MNLWSVCPVSQDASPGPLFPDLLSTTTFRVNTATSSARALNSLTGRLQLKASRGNTSCHLNTTFTHMYGCTYVKLRQYLGQCGLTWDPPIVTKLNIKMFWWIMKMSILWVHWDQPISSYIIQLKLWDSVFNYSFAYISRKVEPISIKLGMSLVFS